MSLPIRTQRFVVTVSASIMPRMDASEVEAVVTRLAFEKERERGMGALGVSVRELLDDDSWEYA
jgi:hypothetical protein